MALIDYRLTSEHLDGLRVAHCEAVDVRCAYRIHTVILLGQGWSVGQVAEALLIDAETVRRYFKRYRKGGIEELLRMSYVGGEAVLDERQRAELDEHMQTKVSLSAKAVAAWVEERRGYTESGMAALLRRLGSRCCLMFALAIPAQAAAYGSIATQLSALSLAGSDLQSATTGQMLDVSTDLSDAPLSYEANAERSRILNDRPADVSITPWTVLRASDFGVTPNSGNVYSRMRSLFSAAKSATKPVKLVFQEGAYEVFGNPSTPALFMLDGYDGLVFSGNGAAFVIKNPRKGFIHLRGSKNVMFEDFSIDYAPLPFSQGRVVEYNRGGKYSIVEVDSGFPRLDASHMQAAPQKRAIIRKRGKPTRVDGDVSVGLLSTHIRSWTQISSTRARVNLTRHIPGIDVGDLITLHGRNNGSPVFRVGRSSRIVYDGVTIYASPGGGFVARNSDHVTLRDCADIPKPGRYMASNADAVHAGGGRTGIKVEGCTFEGIGDDIINIKSASLKLHSVSNATHFVMRGEDPAGLGDEFVLSNTVTGEDIWVGRIISVSQRGSGASRLHTVKTDTPLPSTVVEDHRLFKYIFFNRSWGHNNVVIRDNTFKNSMRFGILFQGRSALIEGNVFNGLRSEGIIVVNEAAWPEGHLSDGVVVTNNGLTDINFRPETRVDGGAVSAWVMVGKWNQSNDQRQKNIFIEGNRIAGWKHNAVFMRGIDNGSVLNNCIETAADAVVIENSSGVVNANNYDLDDPECAGKVGLDH